MFPIKEIMATQIVTAQKDTPILEAANLFVEHRITGIPIIDQERNLVGILSEFDILRLLLETDLHNRKVEDFMTKQVLSFEDNVTAIDVCEFFLDNPSKRRVPITHDGKLVGLVSRADIVKVIVKFRK